MGKCRSCNLSRIYKQFEKKAEEKKQKELLAKKEQTKSHIEEPIITVIQPKPIKTRRKKVVEEPVVEAVEPQADEAVVEVLEKIDDISSDIAE